MSRRDKGPKKGGLIRMGVRGIAGGIGLISESIKVNKSPNEEENAGQSTGTDTHGVQGESSTRDITSASDAPPSYNQVASSSSAQDPYPSDKKINHLDVPNGSENGVTEVEDSLEEEWDLDDAQDVLASGGVDQEPSIPSDLTLTITFLLAHPAPPSPLGSLVLPVVLPQRRPKNRARGFVRGYAPILDNVGISQDTWLEFLDIFQKSSMANPWLNAINMAQFAAIAIPVPGVSIAVGYAIGKIADATIEMESRRKTNNFLEKINAEFFQPRGLYCLVMTWNPDSKSRIESVNITDTIASRASPATGVSGVAQTYRHSDGTMKDIDFPEAAPLIFPALDQLGEQTSGESAAVKTKMASSMAFVGNYWDKRAAATYARDNPNSVLAQTQSPQQEFTSRYSNPKSGAASGSLIAFVSGGKLVPEPHSRGLIGGMVSVTKQAIRGEKQGQAWEKIARNEQGQAMYGRYDREYRGCGAGRQKSRSRSTDGVRGMVKKVIKQNVLYMMVVNLPTLEEMAQVRAHFGHSS
ncbi:hypothetical protein BJ875DRAFT_438433 [Amylocarpus encephaloides]|uniref:Uncharacterized protein n=1 Tax=Amylocarpus encephaloides TaxID=45428 RepID=A0A9P8C8I9_9HELO|nr:hypothetical protein BJ875DRAFT_438433 [Amylocarpus encephaloides]